MEDGSDAVRSARTCEVMGSRSQTTRKEGRLCCVLANANLSRRRSDLNAPSLWSSWSEGVVVTDPLPSLDGNPTLRNHQLITVV